MSWNNFHVNLQNIEYQTFKAALIKLPKKSEYAGYKFWHPLSMIKSGSHSYDLVVSYPDTWEFTIKSNDDELEISQEELANAFEGRA